MPYNKYYILFPQAASQAEMFVASLPIYLTIAAKYLTCLLQDIFYNIFLFKILFKIKYWTFCMKR